MKTASAQKLIVSGLLVCFAIVTFGHYIISPKPPNYPYLSKTDKIADLEPAISWHLQNSAGNILKEIDLCIANLVQGTVICDGELFYKIPFEKNSKEKNNLMDAKFISNNKAVWPYIWSDSQLNAGEFYFSRYEYKLEKIVSTVKKQTVLGKQLHVEVSLERRRPTGVLELLGVEIPPTEVLTQQQAVKTTTSMFFVKHPLGFSLPIKPLPDLS